MAGWGPHPVTQLLAAEIDDLYAKHELVEAVTVTKTRQKKTGAETPMAIEISREGDDKLW